MQRNYIKNFTVILLYFSITQEETELNVHRFTKRKTLVTTKLACKFYDGEGKEIFKYHLTFNRFSASYLLLDKSLLKNQGRVFMPVHV